MDPTFVTEWGPWAFIVYVLVRDILPKLAPNLVEVLSKKITTENRLFTLLEENAKVMVTLNLSFVQLADTIEKIGTVIADKIEEVRELSVKT